MYTDPDSASEIKYLLFGWNKISPKIFVILLEEMCFLPGSGTELQKSCIRIRNKLIRIRNTVFYSKNQNLIHFKITLR